MEAEAEVFCGLRFRFQSAASTFLTEAKKKAQKGKTIKNKQ